MRLIVWSLAFLAMWHPATAHADTVSFLTDLKAVGFGDSDGNSTMIAAGYQACQELAAGVSPSALARQIFTSSELDSLFAAQQFVTIAIHDLCPDMST